ncbi:hypothetical protein PHYBOEH_001931 [Phytophthora boehmeriae]|uniref:M96 mating-specific protein family n=1 Tax=Phytophthora boehmeriae TaxID=109152 RepID=A0A8T1V3U3_9STRA|nr:hypothetical protein PHYBOEH_001931 [Phytophthora boehmeriae]
MTPTEGGFTTLDQALSFIEFCDGFDEEKVPHADEANLEDLLQLNDIGALFDSDVEDQPSDLLGDQQLTDMRTPVKKLRPSKPAISSTEMHRRKNAEIQSLRDRAVELEALLAQLKGSKDGSCHASQSALAVMGLSDEGQRSAWENKAIARYQERSEAQKTNRRLKEILHQQSKTSKTLAKIVAGRKLRNAMNYLRNDQSPCLLDTFVTLDHTNCLKDQLETEVANRYRDFHLNFQPHDPSMIYNAVQPKYDEQHKSTFVEFVTTTPLECSMETAHNLKWIDLESTSDRSRRANTLEKKRTMTLYHSKGTYKLGKLHFLRRFKQKNRVIIIWADIYLLPSKKLQARSFAYSVIERSKTDPMNASVMHTMLKLQVGCLDGNDDKPTEEMKQSQDFVLGAMSRGYRKYWHYEQNRLIEESLRHSSTTIGTAVSATV